VVLRGDHLDAVRLTALLAGDAVKNIRIELGELAAVCVHGRLPHQEALDQDKVLIAQANGYQARVPRWFSIRCRQSRGQVDDNSVPARPQQSEQAGSSA